MRYETTLSWPEVHLASEVGIMRMVNVLKNNRAEPKGGSRDNCWQRHIEGALAELAAAKLWGSFWSGAVGRIDTADVGPLEIRSTERPHGCMILHDDDPADSVFILITGPAPHFTARGWIYGREGILGHDHRYWREDVPIPAYFIPQSALHPFPLPHLPSDNN